MLIIINRKSACRSQVLLSVRWHNRQLTTATAAVTTTVQRLSGSWRKAENSIEACPDNLSWLLHQLLLIKIGLKVSTTA
jgi:hypothetical protein